MTELYPAIRQSRSRILRCVYAIVDDEVVSPLPSSRGLRRTVLPFLTLHRHDTPSNVKYSYFCSGTVPYPAPLPDLFLEIMTSISRSFHPDELDIINHGDAAEVHDDLKEFYRFGPEHPQHLTNVVKCDANEPCSCSPVYWGFFTALRSGRSRILLFHYADTF